MEDWDLLIDAIRNEKCVLFIGPEIVRQYHSSLISSPEFQDNQYFRYIPRDEMFLVPKLQYRSNLVSRFNKFLDKNPVDNEIYRIISEIPFATIIDATRYNFLSKSMTENGFDFQPACFSKVYEEAPEIETPSLNKPLVYNLFGKPKNEASLLLTHGDLFDYLTKLLAANALPAKLKEQVKEFNQIIFLGFKFERWYLQLLLRLFELTDKDPKYHTIATQYDDSPDIISICSTDFNIEFIEEKVEVFMTTLFEKCKGSVEFRKPSFPNSSNDAAAKKFYNLLKESRFEEALVEVEKLEDGKQERNSINLWATWNGIKADKINKTQDQEKIEIRENSLRERLRQQFEEYRTEPLKA